ncbi:uracil-DNA glycosylase [Spirilliplanes yamanashiensis]|uniref:Uracil-DNA glycosylase n=1 Tax=Spirilliplanes yamanashiensis TaxID=42233 RepID=A0A8J4DJG7_9ACTN|nr:uracil-DNA glycosylase [Spirilliplanes yamanashiensis]MDP9815926.1 uracil-DNA glycosylase [Spirilliplanes yamanashiensis]GIJ04182.1 uracil-DNA glycosylase [Spirilliplanes yamanashiensis]
MNLPELLPPDWRDALAPFLDPAATAALGAFVAAEYARHTVYPPVEDLFAAYRLCPPADTRVLILGQDPYHGPGQAHGLSFSVRAGVRVPPSLRNVFKELAEDAGVTPPADGDLTGWARQGVLLLNAVLTVRAGAAASHAGRGWEAFTDATIRALDARAERVVFLLWGGYARKKAALVTGPQHVVLEAGHPSPLNRAGFRGARPFSAANKALADAGRPPVDWDPRA